MLLLLNKFTCLWTFARASLDNKLRVISANNSFYNTFDVKSGEITGVSITDLGNGQWNIPKLLLLLKKILPKKSIVTNYEVEHNFEKIGFRIMSLNANKMHISKEIAEEMTGGEEDLILLAIEDITDRKRVEDILKRDKSELESLVQDQTAKLMQAHTEAEKGKRLSGIGLLAATVAHELRNPLSTMQMAVYAIKQKVKNPDLDNYLATMEVKINESAQIIDNLLSYSHLKPPHYESVNISDLIKECAGNLEKHGKKEMSLTANLDSIKDIIIEADPIQIREVINNILNNAYDAAPSKEGRIKIMAEKEVDFIKVIIEDNGSGIKKEVLDKIFEPFFTTKAKGTGLGLSVCSQIVNMHGGDIKANSEPGSGASFTVRLPIKRVISKEPA